MENQIKNYTNGELSIKWESSKCIHSAICIRGLPEVFNKNARPWINMKGDYAENIKLQVLACPSGALSISNKTNESEMTNNQNEVEVCVLENGPLMVSGTIQVKDKDGNITTKADKSFLCRCGSSENKPYCDGKHKKIGFIG